METVSESIEAKQAHTPGPWETSRDAVPEGHVQITVYAEATGDRVATVFDREANAPLIAAAPDLLAACKWADEFFRATPIYRGLAGLAALRAALAKAV